MLLVGPVLPGGLLPVLLVLLVRPVLPVRPVHSVLLAACARLSSRPFRDTFDRPQTLQPVHVFEALDLKHCSLCTFLDLDNNFLVSHLFFEVLNIWVLCCLCGPCSLCTLLSFRPLRDNFHRPQTLQPVDVFEALDLKPCSLCTFLSSRPELLVSVMFCRF